MSTPKNLDQSNFSEIKALLLEDRVSLSEVKHYIEDELANRKKRAEEDKREKARVAALRNYQSNDPSAENHHSKNKATTSTSSTTNTSSSKVLFQHGPPLHDDEELTSIIAELGAKAKKKKQQASGGGGGNSTNDTEGEQVEKLRGWKPVTISDPSGNHSVIQADVTKSGMTRIERIFVEDRAPRNRKSLLTPRVVLEPEKVVKERLRSQRQVDLEYAFHEMEKALIAVEQEQKEDSQQQQQQKSSGSVLFSPKRAVLSNVVSTPPLPPGWRRPSLNLPESTLNERFKDELVRAEELDREKRKVNNAASSSSSLTPQPSSTFKPLMIAARKDASSKKSFFSELELAAMVGRPSPVWDGTENTMNAAPPASVQIGGASTISRRLRQLRNEAALQSTLELGGSTHEKGKLLQETAYLPSKMRKDMTVGALTVIGQTRTYDTIQREKRKREREKLNKRLDAERNKDKQEVMLMKQRRRSSFHQLKKMKSDLSFDGGQSSQSNSSMDDSDDDDDDEISTGEDALINDQLVFGNDPKSYVQLIPARRKLASSIASGGGRMAKPITPSLGTLPLGKRRKSASKLLLPPMTDDENDNDDNLDRTQQFTTGNVIDREENNNNNNQALTIVATEESKNEKGDLATVLFGKKPDDDENSSSLLIASPTTDLNNVTFGSFGSSPSSILVDRKKKRLKKSLPFASAPDAAIPWTCSIPTLFEHVLTTCDVSPDEDAFVEENIILAGGSSQEENKENNDNNNKEKEDRHQEGKDPDLENNINSPSSSPLEIAKRKLRLQKAAHLQANQLSRIFFGLLEYGLQDFNHKQRITIENFPWEDDSRTQNFLTMLSDVIALSKEEELMRKAKTLLGDHDENGDDDDHDDHLLSSVTLGATIQRMISEQISMNRASKYAPESKKNLKKWIYKLRKALDRSLGELEVDAEDDKIEEQEEKAQIAKAKQMQKLNPNVNTNNNNHQTRKSPPSSATKGKDEKEAEVVGSAKNDDEGLIPPVKSSTTDLKVITHHPQKKKNVTNSNSNTKTSSYLKMDSHGVVLLTKDEKKLLHRDVFGGLDRLTRTPAAGGEKNNNNNNNNNNNDDDNSEALADDDATNTDVVTKQQGEMSFKAAQKLGLLEPLLNKLPASFLFSKAAATIIKGFAGVDLLLKQKQQQQKQQAQQKGAVVDGGGNNITSSDQQKNANKKRLDDEEENLDGGDPDRMIDDNRLDGNFTRYMEMTKGNRQHRQKMKTEENFAKGLVLQARSTLERIKARGENARSDARKKLHDKLEDRKKAAENLLSHRRGHSSKAMLQDISDNAEKRAKVWRLLRMPPEMAFAEQQQQQKKEQANKNNTVGGAENNNSKEEFSSIVTEKMWETRLESLEKNERSAQQCRLFCIRATLALFSTAFPPSPEAVQLLSNFCDVILRVHPHMTPSQFLRWMKLSKNTLLMTSKEKNSNNNNNNETSPKKSPLGSESATPQQQNRSPLESPGALGSLSPITSVGVVADPTSTATSTSLQKDQINNNDDLSAQNPTNNSNSKSNNPHHAVLPWDCVFLQGWIRAELGVATKAHVAWHDLAAQRNAGWAIDTSLQ